MIGLVVFAWTREGVGRATCLPSARATLILAIRASVSARQVGCPGCSTAPTWTSRCMPSPPSDTLRQCGYSPTDSRLQAPIIHFATGCSGPRAHMPVCGSTSAQPAGGSAARPPAAGVEHLRAMVPDTTVYVRSGLVDGRGGLQRCKRALRDETAVTPHAFRSSRQVARPGLATGGPGRARAVVSFDFRGRSTGQPK